MASVHKRSHRGRTSYRAVWSEPGPGGKTRLRNKSFAKAADAKAYAARMAAEIERRGVGDPERHTTGRYLARWLATLRDRGELSPPTLVGYGHSIDLVEPLIGAIPLAKLSVRDLDSAYACLLTQPSRRGKRGHPLSPRTVLHAHRCLHNALEQARKWKLVPENVARDARAPSPGRSPVRNFKGNEVARLLDAAASHPLPDTHAIVATFLTCGLRRSELLGLAWDALDLEAGLLEVRRTVITVANRAMLRERTKTDSSRRRLRIPEALVALLRAQHTRVQEQMLKWGREYQREPLLVFPGLAGVPMTPKALTDRLRRLLRRAGIKDAQPCHGWRHTAATTLIHGGQNLKTVQVRLGHSTPTTTLAIYVHPEEEADLEAAEHLGNLLDHSPKR